MANTYNIDNSDPMIIVINDKLQNKDDFWRCDNKFVSKRAIGKDVEIVTIAMSREQWCDLLDLE